GPDGVTQLAYNDDVVPGLESLISWTAPTSGSYYLEVSGFGSSFGSYNLVSVLVDDHGNTAGGATPTSDPSTNHGVIETFGDTDWFSFSALAGVEYRLETVLGE